MIRYIEELYECEIDTSVDGVAYIYGKNERQVSDAKMLVQDLVVVVKEGDIYSAEVVDVKDFGAVVKIARAKEALLHISEITHDPQLLKQNTLAELLTVGQRLEVQVTAVDKATGQCHLPLLPPPSPTPIPCRPVTVTVTPCCPTKSTI